MEDYDDIRRLFHKVLNKEIRYHQLDHDAIRNGIQNMKEAYKPKSESLSSEILYIVDYNDPAHRCAYIHKYASLHTALVSDYLEKSMHQVRFIIQDILSNVGRIEICSLGGGPGSDVLGVISVLSTQFGFFQLSATIIDYMDKWRHTFGAVIKELRSADYGPISDLVQPQYFSWNYIGHDLFGKMTNDVNRAIQRANLITMIKFVSAAACKDTADMIKKIFRSLKPGALVLFIDNDSGGFYKLMVNGAQEYNMITVYGPLIHEKYINMCFNVQRFGYTPCLETTVTVHMWMKPNNNGPDILSAINLRNLSRFPTGHVNNTLNQYNVLNSNFHVNETNNSNLPPNNLHRKHFSNPRRLNSRNRSPHTPIQRQPQYRRLSEPNSEDNEENNNIDDCNCCVIS